MSDTPAVSIEPHAEMVCAVVRRDALDDATLEQLQATVSQAAAQQPTLPVVLDLTQVSFIPSAGLGTLVMLMRHLKTSGQRFVLVGLQPEVRQVFAITRLDKLFEIQPNVAAAESSVRRA